MLRGKVWRVSCFCPDLHHRLEKKKHRVVGGERTKGRKDDGPLPFLFFTSMRTYPEHSLSALDWWACVVAAASISAASL